ncbi:MAG: hypothetical protein ACYC97_13185 [Metallibacterium sp.]
MSQFIKINENEFVNLEKINCIRIIEIPYIRIEFYNSVSSFAPEYQDGLAQFTDLVHKPIAFSKPFDTVAEAKEWLLKL